MIIRVLHYAYVTLYQQLSLMKSECFIKILVENIKMNDLLKVNYYKTASCLFDL